jgi:hypothetical protein
VTGNAHGSAQSKVRGARFDVCNVLDVVPQGYPPRQWVSGPSPVVNTRTDQLEPAVGGGSRCAQGADRAVPVEVSWRMVVSGRVVLKA